MSAIFDAYPYLLDIDIQAAPVGEGEADLNVEMRFGSGESRGFKVLQTRFTLHAIYFHLDLSACQAPTDRWLYDPRVDTAPNVEIEVEVERVKGSQVDARLAEEKSGVGGKGTRAHHRRVRATETVPGVNIAAEGGPKRARWFVQSRSTIAGLSGTLGSLGGDPFACVTREPNIPARVDAAVMIPRGGLCFPLLDGRPEGPNRLALVKLALNLELTGRLVPVGSVAIA